jgi:hypothetical protein
VATSAAVLAVLEALGIRVSLYTSREAAEEALRLEKEGKPTVGLGALGGWCYTSNADQQVKFCKR